MLLTGFLIFFFFTVVFYFICSECKIVVVFGDAVCLFAKEKLLLLLEVNQRLRFIYKAVPQQYSPNVCLCTVHFTQDLGKYNAGYIQRLLSTVK